MDERAEGVPVGWCFGAGSAAAGQLTEDGTTLRVEERGADETCTSEGACQPGQND
jgi:hypothetical protein